MGWCYYSHRGHPRPNNSTATEIFQTASLDRPNIFEVTVSQLEPLPSAPLLTVRISSLILRQIRVWNCRRNQPWCSRNHKVSSRRAVVKVYPELKN